jgi:hypothetical protein
LFRGTCGNLDAVCKSRSRAICYIFATTASHQRRFISSSDQNGDAG